MRSRLTSSDLGGTPERRSRSRERPADPKTKMDHDRPEKSDDESDEGIDGVDGIDGMEGGGEGDESMPFLPIPSDLRPDVVSSSGDNGFGSISYGDGEEESDSPEKRAFRVLAQYSPPDTGTDVLTDGRMADVCGVFCGVLCVQRTGRISGAVSAVRSRPRAAPRSRP